MKKRVIKIFAGAGVLLLFLTGCGSSASFSEEQTTQMAEYMAKKLLDYDEHYEEKLLEPEPSEETASVEETVPETTPTPAPVPESEEKDSSKPAGEKDTKSQGSLSEVLGCEGIKIQYKEHEICQTYPKNGMDSYFIVEAGPLHKLVVVEFSLKNTLDKQVKLDAMSKTVSYSLEMEDTSVKPSMTLLSNDLQYLEETFPAGRVMNAVLVFEVPSDSKCKNLTLLAESGDKKAQQPLQ